jgi:hypothetical protein
VTRKRGLVYDGLKRGLVPLVPLVPLVLLVTLGSCVSVRPLDLRVLVDDERPPIFVKGGSIHFEATGYGWDAVGGSQTRWRHKLETAQDVTGFRAWVVRNGTTICDITFDARSYVIRYMPSDGSEDLMEFEVSYAGRNVFLDSPRPLTAQGETVSHTDPNGVVVSVGIRRQGSRPGRACPVPHDAQAFIKSQKN